jgi:hypothetical protein
MEARHAEYYAALAERSEERLALPNQGSLLDDLDRELGNFRAVIAWSLRTGNTAAGIRLATALHEFWHLRNHIAEAVGALDDLLAASADDGLTVERERALLHQAGLLTWLADERSQPLAEQGLAMAEQLQDLEGIALGKSSLGWSRFYAEPERALTVFSEGLAAARSTGNVVVQMETLMGVVWSHLLGGNLDEARRLAHEVIAEGERTGVVYHTTFAMVTLGALDGANGDLDAALGWYRNALRRARAAGAHVGTAISLDGIATVALERGDISRAIRLAAAADRLRKEIGGRVTLGQIGLEEPLDRAARLVDPAEFQRLVEAGRGLTVDQAVALALQEDAASPSTDG